MTSSYANSLMDEYFWPYSDAGEYDEAVATLFPHLVDFFAQLYGTNQLYGGTGHRLQRRQRARVQRRRVL